MSSPQKKSIQTSAIWYIIILLVSCTSDPEDSEVKYFTDNRDGTKYSWETIGNQDWMTQDINFQGQNTFTFYEALSVCPEGWRLPTLEDWINLGTFAGGYSYSGTSVKDPESAFDFLIRESGFNGTNNAGYWSSSPAWDESYTIRSYLAALNSGIASSEFNRALVLVPNLKSQDLPCRCIRGERTQAGSASWVSNVGTVNFSDFMSYNQFGNGLLMIHAYNLSGANDEEWIQIGIDLTQLSGISDYPYALKGSVDYTLTAELELYNSDTFSYRGADIDFLITAYDDFGISGSFSGMLTSTNNNSSEEIQIQEASFSLDF